MLQGVAYCQELPSLYQTLTQKEGLSSNQYCYFISQCSNGFIWISSLDGLNRFDGLEVEIYRPNLQSGIADSEKIMSAVIEDDNKNLWFSTPKGVYRWDVKSDTLFHYQIMDTTENKTLNNYNSFYYEVPHNRLWVRAGTRLAWFDTNTFDYQLLNDETRGNWHSVHTNVLGEAMQIWSAPWRNGGGVEMFTKKASGNWEKRTFIEELQIGKDTTATKVLNTITQSDTLVWLLSEKGLISFDWRFPNKKKLYIPDYQLIKFINGLFISNHKLLLGSLNNGLWLFNTKTKKFEKQEKFEKDNPFNKLNSNTIRGLFRDKEQRIWISHKNLGINYSCPTIGFSNRDVINTANISSIFEDHQQNTWIATRFKGLYIIDKYGEVLSYKTHESFDNQFIKEFAIDSKNRVYAITANNIYTFTASYNIEKIVHKKNIEFVSIIDSLIE